MEWSSSPPYAHDGPFAARYRARCHCGAVVFEVSADPVDATFCHCPRCRTLHGAPYPWAAIFHKTDVRFVRGLEHLSFYSAELGRAGRSLPCKVSCGSCHSPLADEGRRMFLAFAPVFDFGSPPRVPAAFAPSCHIFYGQRVLDVPDDKPKYLGRKGDSPLWSGS